MAITTIPVNGYAISVEGRELVNHGTPLFPVAFYHDDLERDRVPWHWHDELEAVFVSSGETVVSAGARRFKLSKGQGFFINAGALHAAYGIRGSNCRYHSLVFHPRLVGGDADSIFWQTYLHPLISSGLRSAALDGSQPWHGAALDQIERAWQEGAAGAPGYEFRVRAALSELVFILVSHLPSGDYHPSEKLKRDGKRIKQMLQYIQLHFSEPVTVSDIAGSALISESECLRCFRSIIGVPPIQYVKRYRVHRAAELLKSTEQGIAEIGDRCGFQDTSYFIRAFREIKGITPGEYRKSVGQ